MGGRIGARMDGLRRNGEMESESNIGIESGIMRHP